MDVDQIVDELKTIVVAGIRAEARADYGDGIENGQVVRRLRSIVVRVRDPRRSGSSAVMFFASPEEYPGRDAVEKELTRKLRGERRGTASRIRSERQD